MKNRNWTRRSVSLLLALITMLLCASLPGVSAETARDIEKEMKEIEARIEAQEKKVNDLRRQQNDQEKLLPALEEEIDAVEAKATVLSREIKRLDAVIAGITSRIDAIKKEIGECERLIDEITVLTEAKTAQIQQLQAELMERLRRQYMNGPASNLQLLLSSADVSTMLTVSEYIARQADEDDRLRQGLELEMAEMKGLQEQLAAQQKTLESRQAEQQEQLRVQAAEIKKLHDERKDLDAQHDKISRSKREIFSIIDGLKGQTREARRIIEKEEKELQEAERRLDNLVSEKLKSGELKDVKNDGKMIWPFPYRDCYITSKFGGNESFRSHSHRGIDISIADKSKTYYIVAALDGTIADYGFHSSMGNYVVIYHGYYAPTGKRVQTTYMHLKSFDAAVKNNAPIKAGKVIGIMGNTGNSTGPHLHFQVNEYTSDSSSVPVDPLKYVKNPY